MKAKEERQWSNLISSVQLGLGGRGNDDDLSSFA